MADVLGGIGLGGPEIDAFCLYYDVTDGGNWEGRTILYNSVPLHAVAFRCGLSDDRARSALRLGREALLDRRARSRTAPGLDDNVIASWNGLAASALAAGYRVTSSRRYLDAAVRCIEHAAFAMRSPDDDDDDDGSGGVSRVARPGRDPVPGGLDDHAHCANALLDVFEAVPDARYLERAAELGGLVCRRFWHDDAGGFFMTAGGEGGRASHRLVVRPRSRHDLSVPSGSSAATRALARLHQFTGDAEFGRVAGRALALHAREAAENPFAFGYLVNAACSLVDDPPEVTVVNAGASPEIAGALRLMYLPGSPLVEVSSEAQLGRLARYPYFEGKPYRDRTEVYVCRAGACSAPMSSLGQVSAALGAAGPRDAVPEAARP